MRVTLGGSFLQRNFALIFGGIWLAVGVPFVIGAFHLWQDERRFTHEAVTTEGKVLSRTIRTSGSRSTSTEHWVTYRFQPYAGPQYEGASQVDVRLWEALVEQGPVTVAYLAGDPRVNRVASAPDWMGAAIMGGLGGVFAIAGGVIVSVSLARRLLRNRLLRSGMTAEGTVTAVSQTNFSINRVPQWVVRYRYRDYRGHEHDGKSGYLSPEEARQWREGDAGAVKYDRERSNKSIWVGRG